MSWATNRKATRPEDMAYCLLGSFAVNMPLLYGEGNKAFLRLQEEIIKRSDDESIFAWSTRSEHMYYQVGILPPYVHCFDASGHVRNRPARPLRPYSITNRGLHMPTKSYRSAIEHVDPLCCLDIVPLESTTLDHAAGTSTEAEFGQYTTPILSNPAQIWFLQCLHDRRFNWYRSRSNDLFIRGIVSTELCYLLVMNNDDLRDVEIFASLFHSSMRQCQLCWEFDGKIIEYVLSMAAQHSMLRPAAEHLSRRLSPNSDLRPIDESI